MGERVSVGGRCVPSIHLSITARGSLVVFVVKWTHNVSVFFREKMASKEMALQVVLVSRCVLIVKTIIYGNGIYDILNIYLSLRVILDPVETLGSR